MRASAINEEMKVAAVRALAQLAREDVPESVLKAYGLHAASRFGREYLIPKPFDPRVLLWVAPAVAQAAMASGVARRPIGDLEAYRESLERILGPSRQVMQLIMHKAQRQRARRIVFPEGEDETIVRARARHRRGAHRAPGPAGAARCRDRDGHAVRAHRGAVRRRRCRGIAVTHALRRSACTGCARARG